MATVKQILDIAVREIGTTENPPNSNKTPYGKEYGWNGVPWCAIFVWVIFNRAGAADLLPVKTASCGQLMEAAKKAELWVTSNYRPGDILIYDFPGGASTDHTGIVEDVETGYVITIEGNTSMGNDSNGGQVMRRRRSVKLVRGAVRPKYETEPEKKNIFLVANEVWLGKWGNNPGRKTALESAGYDYKEVQKIASALSRGGVNVQVSVKQGSTLTMRAKPDVESNRLGVLQRGQRVLVTAVKPGPGAGAWGRIGEGWISLDYVKAV